MCSSDSGMHLPPGKPLGLTRSRLDAMYNAVNTGLCYNLKLKIFEEIKTSAFVNIFRQKTNLNSFEKLLVCEELVLEKVVIEKVNIETMVQEKHKHKSQVWYVTTASWLSHSL